jgi:uncharacterized protein (UPF0332 family)
LAIPDDLLDLARHLASREPKKPRQASLRRAVSTAYYALFHLLASSGAETVGPIRPVELRSRIRRAFTHDGMKAVCATFLTGKIGNLSDDIKSLITPPLEPEFALLANAFIDLQQARHVADYDFSRPMTREEVLSNIDLAERSFVAWDKIRKTDNANVFLTALMLHKHWRANR